MGCMGHATHVADILTIAVTVIEALKVTTTGTLSHSHNCTVTLAIADHNHGSTLSHGTIQLIVLFLLDQDRPHDTTNTSPFTNPISQTLKDHNINQKRGPSLDTSTAHGHVHAIS